MPLQSTYTNSTHVLVCLSFVPISFALLTGEQTRMRIPASQKSGVLCVSASYDGDAREVGFTLSAYAKSGVQMSWIENMPTPPYTKQVSC
jgi:calpain-7